MSAITDKNMIVVRNEECLAAMRSVKGLLLDHTSLHKDLITNIVIPFLIPLYHKKQDKQVKLSQRISLTFLSANIPIPRCGFEVMDPKNVYASHFYYLNKNTSLELPDDIIDKQDLGEIIKNFPTSSNMQQQEQFQAIDIQIKSKSYFTYQQIKKYLAVYKPFYPNSGFSFLKLSEKIDSQKLIFNFSNSRISDKSLKAIASVFGHRVHCLSLCRTSVSDCSPFSSFSSLQHLELNEVEPLEKTHSLPPSLRYLTLTNSAIKNPTVLAPLTCLEWLDISDISDGFHGMTLPSSLLHLECRRNKIENVDFISSLNSLVFLDVRDNTHLNNIAAVARSRLQHLDVQECFALKDLSPAAHVPHVASSSASRLIL